MDNSIDFVKPLRFIASDGIIVFSRIFGVLVILGLIVGIKTGGYEVLMVALIPISLSAIWFSSMVINIENDQFTYRTLLGSASISYDKVKSVKFEIGKKRQTFYALVVRDGNQKEKVIINIKPFSKTAVSTLASVLIYKCPEALLDKYIMDMQSEDFNSIAKAGIANIRPALVRLFWVMFLGSLICILLY
jgi:hypothetical protein